MNWHFNIDGDTTSKTFTAARHIEARDFNNYSVTINQPAISLSGMARNVGVANTINGTEGMSLTNQETQTGLCVQAPLYSRFRMLSNDPAIFAGTGGVDESNTDSIRIESTVHPQNGVLPQDSSLFTYCSIGTDFNFMYFVNVPTWFWYGPAIPNVP